MFFALFLASSLCDGNSNTEEIYNDGEFNPDANDPDSYYNRYRRDPYGYDEYGYDYEQAYDKNGKPICGPNAEKVKGRCKCIEGYDHGNPRSVQGCYKCEGCSQYSTCQYPGTCQCYYGYEGNGSFCRQLRVSVRSVSEETNNRVKVSLVFESDGDLDSGFCRFGGITSRAIEATRSYFICEIPPNLPNHVPIQVSIDAEKWSDDSIIYERPTNEDLTHEPINNTLLAAAFIGAMVLLTLLLKNTRPVANDERKPFIEQKRRPRHPDVRKRTV